MMMDKLNENKHLYAIEDRLNDDNWLFGQKRTPESIKTKLA